MRKIPRSAEDMRIKRVKDLRRRIEYHHEQARQYEEELSMLETEEETARRRIDPERGTKG